jgi:tetratricopeptide (TPR) repeat protein
MDESGQPMSNSTPPAAVAEALERAAAAVAAGRPGQAEQALRRAAAAWPAELPLWDALVELYKDRGLNKPAAECLAHAARAHASRGDLDTARKALSEARGLDPETPRLLHDYGVACLHGGDPEAAAAVFREVLDGRPDDELARLNLARALERMDCLDESEALYLQVMQRRPDAPEPARELAWLLRSAGRFEAAEAGFREVLARWPADPDAAVGLAGLLEMRGAADEARSILEALPESAHARPDVALTEGRLLRRAGRLEEARSRLVVARAGAARDPALAPRWHFEMAALLDALGAAGPAFAEATAGNRLRNSGWDRVAHRRRVDEIIGVFGADAFAAARPVPEDEPLPVFVVGMPRSGTTLAEHLLTGFPGVVAGGERMDFLRHAASLSGYPPAATDPGADRLAAIARDYLSDAGQGLVLVDKMPVNFLHLGLIARVLPGARVIHCARNPLDTLLSCYFQDFTAPFLGFANDLEDLAWYWQDYRRLMAHWAGVLPLSVFELPYEELVTDPDTWIRRLGRFIGRDAPPVRAPEDDRFIATNSAAQVRRPVSDRAVGRHRAYARELAPLAGLIGVSLPG